MIAPQKSTSFWKQWWLRRFGICDFPKCDCQLWAGEQKCLRLKSKPSIAAEGHDLPKEK